MEYTWLFVKFVNNILDEGEREEKRELLLILFERRNKSMMIIMTSLLTRKYKFDVKKKKVFQIHCDKFNNNKKKV